MTLVVLIIAVVVVALAAIVFWGMQRRRSSQLREGFGLEYDRALRHRGSRELDARRKRVEKLRLKEIAPVRAQEYAERWRIVQGRFVDDPAGAIQQADQLCTIVMTERGYPMTDFEQRAADVSVDHPDVVASYRSAHAISQASRRGEASTESLRQAMVNYRSLLDDLLARAMPQGAARPPRESRVAR